MSTDRTNRPTAATEQTASDSDTPQLAKPKPTQKGSSQQDSREQNNRTGRMKAKADKDAPLLLKIGRSVGYAKSGRARKGGGRYRRRSATNRMRKGKGEREQMSWLYGNGMGVVVVWVEEKCVGACLKGGRGDVEVKLQVENAQAGALLAARLFLEGDEGGDSSNPTPLTPLYLPT